MAEIIEDKIKIKDKVVTAESLSALHNYNNNTYVKTTDVIPIENGGTGASTPGMAIANLGITPAKINAEPSFKTLPIIKGGTGSSNGATGLANLFAAGDTVLSPYQYGDELPAAGTVGRIFFKRLTDV